MYCGYISLCSFFLCFARLPQYSCSSVDSEHHCCEIVLERLGITLTLRDLVALCRYCHIRLVLFQTAFATEEDESVLGPFDVVLAIILWLLLGPCKSNCVRMWVVRLHEVVLVRQVGRMTY